MIRYDAGITIDQVMASGAVPEIYDYREINGHKSGWGYTEQHSI